MIPTHPSDGIEDLIRFCRDVRGACKIDDRAGASPEEIESLVSLCGRQLPMFYELFLLEFGRSDAGIGFFGEADGDVCTLIGAYKNESRRTFPEIFPNSILIAYGGLDGCRSLVYPSESSQDEPVVVLNWDGEILARLGKTFLTYVYSQVFWRARFSHGARRDAVLLAEDVSLFSNISSYCLELGFKSYWFSDEFQSCLEREGRTIILRGNAGGLYVWVSCDEKGDGAFLRNNLKDKFDLKDLTPPIV